jgi:hypothetical protein
VDLSGLVQRKNGPSEISVSEFLQDVTRNIEIARKGRSFLLTFNGKPEVMVVPYASKKAELTRQSE